MKNKITLLEELRQEREIVRQECIESEDRLTEQWNYLSDNASSLLLDSAVSGIASWLGFGHKEKAKEESESSSGNIVQTAWNGVMAYYPLIWEIVQPLLWRYAVKKVKSLFSGKKKKRSDD